MQPGTDGTFIRGDGRPLSVSDNLCASVNDREGKMPMEARQVELRDIEGLRDIYRLEMSCQIILDSVHPRPGWSKEYLLIEGGTKVGYGSLAVGGPWREKPTLYEFFVLPQNRSRVFDLFE